MPDITMCENKECSLSSNCWRFNAPSDRVSQAYAEFEQDGEGNCWFYIPMNRENFPEDYDETTNSEF